MTGSADMGTGPRQFRRSRRTLWLAAIFAVVACLPFVLVFTRTGLNTPEPLILTDADQRSLRDGLRMVSPSFSGRTEDGEPYTVTADWALPNGPKPTRITLHRITATVVTKDGREAVMTSDRGVFFPRKRELRLSEGVMARTSDGYILQTLGAEIDLDARALQADSAVEARGPRGSIKADTLEAQGGDSRTVIFRGNVRVVFTPETVSPQSND